MLQNAHFVGAATATRRENKTFFSALTTAAKSPEARALLVAVHSSALEVAKHVEIPRRTNSLLVLLRGCVCSYRLLPNGSRQILRVLAPGELCNPWLLYSENLDINLVSSGPSRLVSLPLERLRALPDANLISVLQATMEREHQLLMETLVILGRGTARERVIYFLLDLADRLQQSGLALDDSFDIGVTQIEMADALGISAVHANRALYDLKAAGMIQARGKHYDILDRAAMERTVAFRRRAVCSL